MMCKSLSERLRQARKARGLSLEQISRSSGVREQNLALIDQDAFEKLPTGIYGRTAVRAYAAAVGISKEEALAEVADRLPAIEDPLDGLARVRGLPRQRPRDEQDASDGGQVLASAGQTFTRVVRAKITVTRAAFAHLAPAGFKMSGDALSRVKSIEALTRVRQQVGSSWRAPAAALLDGAVLLTLDFVLLRLTAQVVGASATDVLRAAAPSMLAMFAFIAALYFVLLGGIARATIGSWAAHVSIDMAMLDDVMRMLKFRRV